MLVNGIMIPVTAFLIQRFSTRKLFMTAVGLFAFGTGLAAMAASFTLLLIGRIFQGSGAGIMMYLLPTSMFLMIKIHRCSKADATLSLANDFAPAKLPTILGYLVERFHWRSVFYVLCPIAVINLIAAYFYLKNVTEQKDVRVDVLSIILSTIGFGALLYGFSIAGNVGWINPQV